MSVQTFKNKKGQMIGYLATDVFRKKVKASKHIFRLMDAWGVQKEVIDALSEVCKEIRILEEESNIVYSISFEDFLFHAVERTFGDGPQLFVSRKFFKKEKRPVEK